MTAIAIVHRRRRFRPLITAPLEAEGAVSMRARPNDIVDAVHATLIGRVALPPAGGRGIDSAGG